MNGTEFFDMTFCGRLCFTLLHSLWQVALLATIVWFVDRRWQKSSVDRSYALHVGALVLSLIALPITFTIVQMPASLLQRTAGATTKQTSESPTLSIQTVAPLPIDRKSVV